MTFTTVDPQQVKSTHQANLLTLLTRRLEVAKASQNQQLVTALEREYEQLTSLTTTQSVDNWLQSLWMGFAETLSDWTKVHIQQTVNAKGQTSWYAYNPQAGQMLHTDSADEMRRWIKQTYWKR
ncbi:hypothetical protein [Leptothoe sp. PORK10 BA2]|uniref:hypothetical protein n=1 Tax=Leptothoe sp. PORK10 BA2 TaxID=3110254 RepID=UPI002B20AA68|nr:hypothetical protein [Leptothoe sp. PORK10 BA2]MEA5463772.1 hypothetical protein [Leptothoe sp. PORK10 BA2]